MQGNGLAFVQPRTKIFAFQHTRQAVVRTEPNDILGGHFAEPFAVVTDFCFFLVEYFENLGEIRFGVSVHSFAGERRARFGLSRGIADHRREITDQENRGVAEILKMF